MCYLLIRAPRLPSSLTPCMPWFLIPHCRLIDHTIPTSHNNNLNYSTPTSSWPSFFSISSDRLSSSPNSITTQTNTTNIINPNHLRFITMPTPGAKKGYLLTFALPTHPSFLPPSGSHEVFNKWYNKIHIPDVLTLGATSGFVSAIRYARVGFNPSSPSISSTANYMAYPKNVEWQFLAMYALEDVERGMGRESGLYKVPLESELLPAKEGQKKGKALEVARWEMGFWEVVGETEEKEGGDSPTQTDIILTPLDSSDIPGSDTPGAHPSSILDYSRKGWEGPDPVRSTLLKFIAPAPGGDGTGIKTYLAVHKVESNTKATVKPELQTVRYKLLERFGGSA